MEFRILGPLEVRDDGREISIRGRKLQALLVLLLLRNGEVVSRGRLIDDLWGDDPPPTAAKTLQAHVSRLRRELGDVVESQGGGYLVRVQPDHLDLDRFEQLVADGRRALAEGGHERAFERLNEALALWRGPALPELADEPFARVEAGRLEDARLDALEARLTAELELGRHAEAIHGLEPLVARHPYRERLHELLMLALYRAGRQVDALAAYRDARKDLVDELGVEPGTRLRELHSAMLAQDPALETPAAAPSRATRDRHESAAAQTSGDLAARAPVSRDVPASTARRRRRALVAGAAGAAAAVVLVAVLFAARNDAPHSQPLSNDSHAVAVIDPSSLRVTNAASVGTSPGPLAYDPKSRSLWAGNLDDRSVTRIDVRPVKTGRTIAIPERPADLVAGDGSVWVAGALRTKPYVTARRIDARFDTSGGSARVGTLPDGSASMSLSRRALWVAPSAGGLTRLNPETGALAGSPIEAGPAATIAAGHGAVWVGDDNGVVSRVDTRTRVARPIPVSGSPADIALGARAVWVTLAGEDAVARIDPASGAVRSTTPVGQGPAGIAVGAGGVWIANSGDGTVTRLEPRSGRVTDTIEVGASPQDVIVADGRVWVSVRPRAPVEAAPGGTITMATQDSLGSLDPALGYGVLEFAIFDATCAKLVNASGRPGAAGARPVPELAQALPQVSNGGRTYTFALRGGFRFGPPSGEPVTAQSMKYTIERTLSPRTQSPAAGLVADLVGGAAYAQGRARHISGVSASGNKLTLRLVRPSPSFLTRMALPFFCAVPAGTPIDPEGLSTVPSAGPYYVATLVPDEEVVLRRNPNYRGSRRGAADELRITLGASQKKSVAAVEAGKLDYTPIGEGQTVGHGGEPPFARRLRERYGPGGTNAKAGSPRYVVKPMLELDQLIFNTGRPPFSSARLRRAVNYALDRRLLARVGLWNGLPAQPTDQYLPPTMPGFRDARIYPLRPDVARARQLAGPRRRSVVLYTAGYPSHMRVAEITRVNLRAIGMDVEIKNFGDSHWSRIARPGEPFDLAIAAWASDYPDPTDYLNQLDGRTVRDEANANFAHFDDPDYNRRLDAAEELPSPARELALGKLDVHTARTAAPWAAIANSRTHDFFSGRVGCQRYNALNGVELRSLCVRRD